MTSVLHVSTFFKCRFQSDHISQSFTYTDSVIRKDWRNILCMVQF